MRAPTRVLAPLSAAGFLVLALLAGACESRPRLPTAPTEPAPVSATLSGTVFEVTRAGRLPAAGHPVRLVLVLGNCPAPTCSGSIAHRSVTAGPDGRYHFSSLPPAGSAFIASETSTHRQVCGAAVRLSPGAQLDVEITPRADPQTSPTVPPVRVTGQIFEMTPAGRRGIGGASIYVDYLFPDLPFLGISADADGHYTACGIPEFARVALWAAAAGYDESGSWFQFTTDRTLDIELKRGAGDR